MSPLVDCYSVLHVHLAVTADACAGARAAIRVGELQAKATRNAGHVGVIAGLAALLAGLIAYAAATRESRRLQRVEAAKQLAFASHLAMVLIDATQDLTAVRSYAEQIVKSESDPAREEVKVAPPELSRSVRNALTMLEPSRWAELGNLDAGNIGTAVGVFSIINDVVEVFDLIRDYDLSMKERLKDASPETAETLARERRRLNARLVGFIQRVSQLIQLSEALTKELLHASRRSKRLSNAITSIRRATPSSTQTPT